MGKILTAMAMVITPLETTRCIPGDASQWSDQDGDGYGDGKQVMLQTLSPQMEHNGLMLMAMVGTTQPATPRCVHGCHGLT